jgi:1-acyl-sn-glycerol-3-phosphate acyltransferase
VAEYVYPPVIALLRLLFLAQGLRFHLEGTENVPRQGGAVMAINHFGYFDFAYAGLAARPAKRLVRFMAKHELFAHPVAGPLMRGMHHIPVDRSAGMQSYRAALKALRAGEIVGIFPEATISRSFELKEFKTGAVRMAAAAGVPLLPTVIWGSQRIWTKSGGRRRLGRSRISISISVGQPIPVPRSSDFDRIATQLRERMSAMLQHAQLTYPDRPDGAADRWWLPARLGGSAPAPERAAELDAAEARARARSGTRRITPRRSPRAPRR